MIKHITGNKTKTHPSVPLCCLQIRSWFNLISSSSREQYFIYIQEENKLNHVTKQWPKKENRWSYWANENKTFYKYILIAIIWNK